MSFLPNLNQSFKMLQAKNFLILTLLILTIKSQTIQCRRLVYMNHKMRHQITLEQWKLKLNTSMDKLEKLIEVPLKHTPDSRFDDLESIEKAKALLSNAVKNLHDMSKEIIRLY